MMLLRRFGSAAFVLVCIAIVIASGGCEAIVTGDVPGSFNCVGDLDSGACPGGSICINAKCFGCPNGDCTGIDPDAGIGGDCSRIDKDGDGYTLCGHLNDAGTALTPGDCDDSDPTVHPNAQLVCNGRDNNCDNIIDDPCPTGQTCAPKTQTCIDSATACTTGNCPAPKVCDEGTKQCVLKGATKLGDACQADSECETGAFCGYSSALTTDITGNGSICTKACCTSTDCPSDFVCFGAGTGGNYCVSKGTLGRPALGTKGGGAACDSGSSSECRSGMCGTDKKCQDTCCGSSQCASGTQCRTMDLTGKGATTKFVLGCTTPPTSSPAVLGGHCESPRLLQPNYPACGEGACTNNGDNSLCSAPCCGSAACSTTCDNISPYNHANGAVVTACSASGVKGAKELGQACANDTECAGAHCFLDRAGGYCSDACCTDADCSSAGLLCRPYDTASSHYLRCQRPLVATSTSVPVP